MILDFRPRLANRCSQKVKSGAIRAAILDFKPRLANRCSQKAKTGAVRAVIPDFRPRIGNRCQRRGQNGGNPSSPREDGIVPRPGNAGWAGTSDGVAARGFVNGEGPAAQRWEGKHRRCAPVRSPCPQAESAAETGQTPQADSTAETGQTPQADSDSGTRPSPRRVRKSYWTD